MLVLALTDRPGSISANGYHELTNRYYYNIVVHVRYILNLWIRPENSSAYIHGRSKRLIIALLYRPYSLEYGSLIIK